MNLVRLLQSLSKYGNGEVPVWNTARRRFVPSAAGGGTVTVDPDALAGDGSVGAPLAFQSAIDASTLTQIRVATVTLNNAQIKALPTTPVPVFPVPGTGEGVSPLYVLRKLSGVWVPYSHFLTDGTSTVQLTWGANVLNASQTWDASSELGEAAASFSRFVAPAGPFPPDNQALYLAADNVSAENQNDWIEEDFTGGDPANTIQMTVFYLIVDL